MLKKHLLLLYIFVKTDTFFQNSLMFFEEQFLSEMETFCKIINVSTVTF